MTTSYVLYWVKITILSPTTYHQLFAYKYRAIIAQRSVKLLSVIQILFIELLGLAAHMFRIRRLTNSHQYKNIHEHNVSAPIEQ